MLTLHATSIRTRGLTEVGDGDIVTAPVRLSVLVAVIHEGGRWMSERFVEHCDDLVIQTILELPGGKLGDSRESVCKHSFTIVDGIWV